MLPSWTEEEVIPVWSLKALAGIFDPPLPAEVVAVDEDLVELQATPVAPTSTATPAAAIRTFHDAACNTPPRSLAGSLGSLPRSPGPRPPIYLTVRQMRI
jgi:hypothetical protein